MIQNKDKLEEIRLGWISVEKLREQLKVNSFTILSSGSVLPQAIVNAAHNVPFIHAYAVFHEVLKALQEENVLKCKSYNLGPLLKASKKHIQWHDYSIIDEGREARNRLAHEAEYLQREKCWRFIDHIELELKSLKLI